MIQYSIQDEEIKLRIESFSIKFEIEWNFYWKLYWNIYSNEKIEKSQRITNEESATAYLFQSSESLNPSQIGLNANKSGTLRWIFSFDAFAWNVWSNTSLKSKKKPTSTGSRQSKTFVATYQSRDTTLQNNKSTANITAAQLRVEEYVASTEVALLLFGKVVDRAVAFLQNGQIGCFHFVAWWGFGRVLGQTECGNFTLFVGTRNLDVVHGQGDRDHTVFVEHRWQEDDGQIVFIGLGVVARMQEGDATLDHGSLRSEFGGAISQHPLLETEHYRQAHSIRSFARIVLTQQPVCRRWLHGCRWSKRLHRNHVWSAMWKHRRTDMVWRWPFDRPIYGPVVKVLLPVDVVCRVKTTSKAS